MLWQSRFTIWAIFESARQYSMRGVQYLALGRRQVSGRDQQKRFFSPYWAGSLSGWALPWRVLT